MLTRQQHFNKRVFDLVLAFLLLPFALIPVFLLWLMASLHFGKNGLFGQLRIGRHGRPFRLYKIRSLKGRDHQDPQAIQEASTAFGRWLRRSKLDELPQLFNILKGEMSWVGPRPDVPGYADKLEGDDRLILELRPGLTGPATLKYRDEDELLLKQPDPLAYNDQVIWPDKVAINKMYIENWSITRDIHYLWATLT